MLVKIKSKFIFDNLFEFIQKDFEKFKLKLIYHNKALQKILGLDLIDYQKNFLKQKSIFYNQYPLINFDVNNFNKNFLYKKVEDDLKEHNLKIDDVKNIFEKYNKKYFKKENNNKIFILDDEINIYDIYSPFIDAIIPFQNDIFINIPLNYVKKYNLINDYKIFFEKNINNITLLNISIDEVEQIKLLNELNFNSFLIECIFIELKLKENINDKDENNENLDKINNENNNLILQLFEFLIKQKNLNSLKLNLNKFDQDYTINNNIFTSLNNLQSLKYLNLEYLNLSDKFIIKLEQLEILKIYYCNNIYFENNVSTKNIKYLYLNNLNEDIDSNDNYNFPNLEELIIYHSKINFNYESLIKLKKLEFEKIMFLENCIKYSPIEEIKQCGNFFEKEDEIKLINIIINKKTLNNVNIQLNIISNERLKEINKTNENILCMTLKLNIYEFDIQYFIKLFPNLKELNLDTFSLSAEEECVKFENDDNIKLDTICIRVMSCDKSIYFSFKNIKNIFLLDIDFINTDILPLFNDECNINFDLLERLYIRCMGGFSYTEALENLYNNLDKCKNLKELSIELITNIDKEFYLKFIEKIISKKLNYFLIFIDNEIFSDDFYSLKELNEMFPNIKINEYYYNYLNIQKLN